MEQEEIIQEINKKYEKLGENPTTYFKGLLQAKPINYWDYIEVDTLLSLQKPRTDFPDEEIFIMYHQVTELTLKLMLHEIKQIVANNSLNQDFLTIKMRRVIRYTKMLVDSFDIMSEGMDYDDYNTFRMTLAPASGVQSVSFRILELHCTRIENLVNEAGKELLPENPSLQDYFDHIYWKDAGTNKQTGEKTLTLRQFEEKYMDQLVGLGARMKGNSLEEKIINLGTLSDELVELLREFDYLYNIAWPMVHINTARTYLDKKGENKAATGGSQWKRYLHPAFQQRKFFPSLWTSQEISDWGKDDQYLNY